VLLLWCVGFWWVVGVWGLGGGGWGWVYRGVGGGGSKVLGGKVQSPESRVQGPVQLLGYATK